MADVTGQVNENVLTPVPTPSVDDGTGPKILQPNNQIPFAGTAAGSDAVVINAMIAGLVSVGLMQA